MLQLNNVESILPNNDWPDAVDKEYLSDSSNHVNAAQFLYRTYLGYLIKHLDTNNRSCNIFLPDFPVLSSKFSPIVDDYKIGDKKKPKKYNVCIIYDVIDHLGSIESIHKFLNSIKYWAKLYLIRCHPYQSRCGNHLTNINKAYIHLFDSTIIGRPTLIFEDLNVYHSILSSHFTVLMEQRNEEPIEEFFLNNNERRSRLEYFDCPHVQTIDFILKNCTTL